MPYFSGYKPHMFFSHQKIYALKEYSLCFLASKTIFRGPYSNRYCIKFFLKFKIKNPPNICFPQYFSYKPIFVGLHLKE